MPADNFTVRPANAVDLEAINATVEACVMSWDLAPRVKRLALSSYLYGAHDLATMEVLLAIDVAGKLAGLAALEEADKHELPDGRSGLQLHGLYVKPELQGQGIGALLVSAALDAAREHGRNGLLVKAQKDATGFFEATGFSPLPIGDAAVDYANRWWKPTD